MDPNLDEKAIFLAALDIAAEDREAFLLGACPDEATRQRIRLLLDHHKRNSTVGFESAPDSGPAGPGDPHQIDEFRILHKLGEGGMGVVYLAEDTILARRVALKVIGAHLLGSEQAVARFRDEARAAALLNHPAIVPVYKYGSDGSRHYIASEYVDGPTLCAVIEDERSRRRDFSRTSALNWFKRSAEIVATLADALDASHRVNIIHRDVKPSNVLIDKHRGPRLTDFGVAKNLAVAPEHTVTTIVGSCHYMSPEQASISSTSVDQRSDIFSLGVVLYEMLTLQKPFVGADLNQVLRAVIEHNPPAVRSLDSRIPRDLQVICHKAMEKLPRDRYQSMAHMAADLRCYLRGDPILARPPHAAQKLKRWILAHRVATLSGLVILLLMITLFVSYRQRKAWERTQAWVQIPLQWSGCGVMVQRVDLVTMQLGPPVQKPGDQNFSLEPGSYRITLVAPDGRFAEIDRPLSSGELLVATGPTLANVPVDDMVKFEAERYEVSAVDDPTRNRTVQLPPFFLDRREVSNAEYREFIDATRNTPPMHWQTFGFDESLANLPVIGIDVGMARNYAEWRGKRLPTAVEWEAAARFPDGRLLPFDPNDTELLRALEPDCNAVRQSYTDDLNEAYAGYKTYAKPVNFFLPGTASGPLLHVFGNVREFTSSIDGRRGQAVIIKGRCWIDAPNLVSLATKWSHPAGSYSFKTGFRCARSAKPPL